MKGFDLRLIVPILAPTMMTATAAQAEFARNPDGRACILVAITGDNWRWTFTEPGQYSYGEDHIIRQNVTRIRPILGLIAPVSNDVTISAMLHYRKGQDGSFDDGPDFRVDVTETSFTFGFKLYFPSRD